MSSIVFPQLLQYSCFQNDKALGEKKIEKLELAENEDNELSEIISLWS